MLASNSTDVPPLHAVRHAIRWQAHVAKYRRSYPSVRGVLRYFVRVNWATLERPLRKRFAQPVR